MRLVANIILFFAILAAALSDATLPPATPSATAATTPSATAAATPSAATAAAASSSNMAVEDLVDAGIERGMPLFESGFDGEWKRRKRDRFHAGGFALADECERLVTLMSNSSMTGRQCISTHTVYERSSPYTPRENVDSVRAIQLVREAIGNKENYAAVQTFLELAARMRHRIMREFNQTTLYYHLTEMVCRTPRKHESPESCMREACLPHCPSDCPSICVESGTGTQSECEAACTTSCKEECRQACSDEEDAYLSHPIHADANAGDCDMLDDGLCVRRLPEDYTAHLYLNEDIEGGAFFFTPDMSGRIRTRIQPTCGRMVAYSSGFENLHGVEALKHGRRCLVTTWLSPRPEKAEELPLEEGSVFLEGRRRGQGRLLVPP